MYIAVLFVCHIIISRYAVTILYTVVCPSVSFCKILLHHFTNASTMMLYSCHNLYTVSLSFHFQYVHVCRSKHLTIIIILSRDFGQKRKISISEHLPVRSYVYGKKFDQNALLLYIVQGYLVQKRKISAKKQRSTFQ